MNKSIANSDVKKITDKEYVKHLNEDSDFAKKDHMIDILIYKNHFKNRKDNFYKRFSLS